MSESIQNQLDWIELVADAIKEFRRDIADLKTQVVGLDKVVNEIIDQLAK